MFGNINIHAVYIPALVPLVQTALTISVYCTVCIAISGVLVVKGSENDSGPFRCIATYLRFHSVVSTIIALAGIITFGVAFNLSRWFELEVLEVKDPEEEEGLIYYLKVRKTSFYTINVVLQIHDLQN